MVAAIIIAPITDIQMKKDLKARGININNKLLLRPGYPLIVYTIYNVLDSGVDECILVLKDSADKIQADVLEIVRNDNLKIIKAKVDDGISEMILNGVNEVKSGICLCISGDQPAVTPDTLKNLINESLNNSNSPKIVSVLVKGKSGPLNSINSLGMPLATHTDILKKYLENKKCDLNPILKEIKKDKILFYGISPINDIELLTISTCKEYNKFLEGKNYINHPYKHKFKNFFAFSNLSNNFKIYFGIFIIFSIISFIFFPAGILITDIESVRSILSTLIQSEAAIIAIIVTLSLVAVQLTASSYSTRVIDLFKGELSFWILMFTYILSIIYGLIILKFTGSSYNIEIPIWIAIFIGIFALFALVPYILDILDLMKPSTIISKLESKIKDDDVLYFIITNESDDPLQPLVDVIHSSLMKHDYGTLRDGIEAIEDYNKNVYQNTETFDHEKGQISLHILEHLIRIGKLAVNIKDEDAATQVISAITLNAIYAAKKEFIDLIYLAINSMKNIIISAIHNDLNSTAGFSLLAFNSVILACKDLENVINVIDEISSSLNEIEEYNVSEKTERMISDIRMVIETFKDENESK